MWHPRHGNDDQPPTRDRIRDPRRLAALRAVQLLDTDDEERFDRLTRLGCRLLEVPIALVSLVDERRQWFKSACGTTLRETPVEHAFCGHTINRQDTLVVEDARQNDDFIDNPMVSGPPHIRFYAGAPIHGPDHQILGTFCVVDTQPRVFGPRQRDILESLARLTSLEIARRQETHRLSGGAAAGTPHRISASALLGDLLRHIERRHIAGDAPRLILAELLDDVLRCLQGEYGLVGVMQPADAPDPETLEIIGLSLGEVTTDMHDFFLHGGRSLDLTRLDTMTGGGFRRPMVQYLAPPDMRAMDHSHLPASHPPLRNALLVPFLRNERVIGTLVVANLAHAPDNPTLSALAPLQQLGGRMVRAFHDARQRDRLQAALEEFRATLDATLDVILIVDEESRRFSYCNQGALNQLGYSESDLLAMHSDRLNPALAIDALHNRLHSLDASTRSLRFELNLCCRDGGEIPVQAVIQRIAHHATGRSNYIIVARDLRDSLQAQREIDWISRHDILTRQLNRYGFLHALAHAGDEVDADRPLRLVAVYGTDRFKRLNEAHGTQRGDATLQELAQVLDRLTGAQPGALLARVGGDEFAVAIRVAESHEAVALTERWRKTIENHAFQAIEGLQLTVSTGLAIDWQGDLSPEELLRRANAALMRAKQGGRNRFRQYLSGMFDEISRHETIERRLAGAFVRQDFFLTFQPQWALGDLSIPCGAEVLLRWHDAELGSITPDVFIPVLEESGMMLEVGRWIIESALDSVAAARDQLPAGFFISINISAVQLMDDKELPEFIVHALAERDLPPEVLEVEVTETALIQSPKRVGKQLERLHRRAIAIALDDFGTGFSSLSHLKQFPFDTVKIDKSFIAGLPSATEDRAIVESLLTLCHGFGRRVCAEGIETPAQLDFLRRLRCQRAQGYLLARPERTLRFGPPAGR
ncbi:MAG: PAS/PAC and MHYT sensor-containing diguanylate cyclase/phosphodiesterase [Halomonadaceae bacterium T82-2]|nr:MAG: PAS/PAC and MHYT sensor-containing diguanylate cyclase/phosphodiesterase [Halomonadaceae bacterium T82-2]